MSMVATLTDTDRETHKNNKRQYFVKHSHKFIHKPMVASQHARFGIAVAAYDTRRESRKNYLQHFATKYVYKTLECFKWIKKFSKNTAKQPLLLRKNFRYVTGTVMCGEASVVGAILIIDKIN